MLVTVSGLGRVLAWNTVCCMQVWLLGLEGVARRAGTCSFVDAASPFPGAWVVASAPPPGIVSSIG